MQARGAYSDSGHDQNCQLVPCVFAFVIGVSAARLEEVLKQMPELTGAQLKQLIAKRLKLSFASLHGRRLEVVDGTVFVNKGGLQSLYLLCSACPLIPFQINVGPSLRGPPHPEQWNQSAGPSLVKILGVWEGQYLL